MYFEDSKTKAWSKRSAAESKIDFKSNSNKKGAGRILHSPRCSSRFAYCAIIPFVISPTDLHLGGQNLAALSTTAGQNLAAVGSSHSLTETVNLGTMTAAGLVGTLHYTFTS